jgi:hypothetical protein
MENNIKPNSIQLEFQNKLAAYQKQASDNPNSWNTGTAMAANKKTVTRQNIGTLFTTDFTGDDTLFKDALKDHPELKSWLALDGNPNELSDSEWNMFIEEMQKPENFEMAKGYIAEYMTLKQEAIFNKQVKDDKKKLYRERLAKTPLENKYESIYNLDESYNTAALSKDDGSGAVTYADNQKNRDLGIVGQQINFSDAKLNANGEWVWVAGPYTGELVEGSGATKFKISDNFHRMNDKYQAERKKLEKSKKKYG